MDSQLPAWVSRQLPLPLPAPVPSSIPALSRVCVPMGTKTSFLCPDLIETLSPSAFGKHRNKLPGYVCLSVMLPAKPSCLWETLRFSLTNLSCTNFSSAVSMLMADGESAKHPPSNHTTAASVEEDQGPSMSMLCGLCSQRVHQLHGSKPPRETPPSGVTEDTGRVKV